MGFIGVKWNRKYMRFNTYKVNKNKSDGVFFQLLIISIYVFHEEGAYLEGGGHIVPLPNYSLFGGFCNFTLASQLVKERCEIKRDRKQRSTPWCFFSQKDIAVCREI